MKTAVRHGLLFRLIIIVLLLGALTAASVVLIRRFKPKPVDPHEGMVYIDDGFGMVWMTPLEGVDVNGLTREDFRNENGAPVYAGTAFDTLRGVDVSEHQQEIDWSLAAQAMDYAYIRVGYRGYGEKGNLVEDPYYEANMSGALNNGLPVGVYMFSQAVTVAEALEEANFVIDRLKGYKVSLPVIYDWEKIDGGGARTDELAGTVTLTDCAVAFCQTLKNAGYDAGVYFNRYIGYYGYDLSRLTGYKFWAAVPGDFPDFYYACDMWQYTFEAEVPGITTPADMNLMFLPRPAENAA